MHKNRFLRGLLSVILAASIGISAANPERTVNRSVNTVQASEIDSPVSGHSVTAETEIDPDAAAETNTDEDVVLNTYSDETDIPEPSVETEENYGWVEFVTGSGGSISASFVLAGETYDEGTFTFDMMEYGPWEAQYETEGILTVTAMPDEGYVFEEIRLTNEDGAVLDSCELPEFSFSADVNDKMTVTAYFAEAEYAESEAMPETESEYSSEKETGLDSETECETDPLLNDDSEVLSETELDSEPESEFMPDTDSEILSVDESGALNMEELREIEGWPVEHSREDLPRASVWYRDSWFDIADYAYYGDEVCHECQTDLSDVDYSPGSSVTVTYRCTLKQDDSYYWYAAITFYFVENAAAATIKSEECDFIMPSAVTQSLNEGYNGIVPELAGTEVEGREYSVLVGDASFDIYGLATDYNDDYFKVSMYDDGGIDVNIAGDYTVVYSMSYYLYPDYAWYVINTVHVVEGITENGITVIVDGVTLTAESGDGKAEYGIWYYTNSTDFVMNVSDMYDLELLISATKDGETIDPCEYVIVSEGQNSLQKLASFSVSDAAEHSYVFILSNAEELDGKVLVNGGGWLPLDEDTAQILETADEETLQELLDTISDAVAQNDGDTSSLLSEDGSAAAAVSADSNAGIMTTSLTGTTTVGTFTASGRTGATTGDNHYSDGSTSAETNYGYVYASGHASTINDLLDSAGFNISVDENDLGTFGIYCISGHSYWGWTPNTSITATVTVKVKEYSDGSYIVTLSVYKSWGSGYQIFAGSYSLSAEPDTATVEITKTFVGYKLLTLSSLVSDYKTTFAIYEVKKDSNGDYITNSSTLAGTLKLTEDNSSGTSYASIKLKGSFTVDSGASYIVVETYRLAGTASNSDIIYGPYTNIEPGETRYVGYINGKKENGLQTIRGTTPGTSFAYISGSGNVCDFASFYVGALAHKTAKKDNAPLEGAVFRVEYYATAKASLQDTSGYSPVGTWYFKTDSTGLICYDDEYYLSSWKDPETGTVYTSDALWLYLDGDPDQVYSSGTQNFYALPNGSIKITEVEAPEGYILDVDTVRTASITFPNTNAGSYDYTDYHSVMRSSNSAGSAVLTNGLEFVNEEDSGYLYLKKASANTSVTENNSGYTLTGAQYTVFTDEICSTAAKDSATGADAVLTVAADHTSNTVCLTAGTYYVKETGTPTGYVRDTAVHTIEVTADNDAENPKILSVSETPIAYTADLIVKKISAKNTEMSLSGAVFKFEFYAGKTGAGGTATKTWYFQSDADGSVKLSADSRYYLSGGTYKSDTLYYDSGSNVCIPLGYLEISEVKAPTGFTVSDDVITYTLTESGYTITGANAETISGTAVIIPQEAVEKTGYIDNMPICGGLSLQKVDYMLGRNADHGDTDLNNAVFAIVNASAESVYNIFDERIETTGLTDDTAVYAKIKDYVDKSDSSGINYVMQTITTDANGFATTDTDGDGKDQSLPYGTYYVIETAAATGYQVNTSWVGKIEVTEDEIIYKAQTIRDSDSEQETTAQQIYRGGISLAKEDLEMQADCEQGISCFADAKFAIINASDALVKNSAGVEIPSAKNLLSGTPDYNELRAIADDGSYTVQTMITDQDGKCATGDYDLPYGTYYIIETESSYGYWIDESFLGLAVIREDGIHLGLGETSVSGKSYFIDINDVQSKLASAVDQQVRRKDLSFTKVNIDGEYKAYIPFLITAVAVDEEGNETELESHVIVSDVNGLADTSRTHSVNTNGFDQYIENGKVTAEGEALLEEASSWGIWFQGNGTMDTENMSVTDEYGALYPGYYRITELSCEDNANLSENLLNSEQICLYNDSADLTELLSENGNAQKYVYHPLIDTEITLTSQALDTESDTQTVAARSSVEVSDIVTYTHVSSDHRYRMETQFVDITDGSKVLTIQGSNDMDAVISNDGFWVAKEFQPEKVSGTNSTYGDMTMTALLDTENLNGHTIAAVDYLYQYVNIDSKTGYWILVAKHEDLTDTDQMLYVPDIHTNARDSQTGSRTGTKAEDSSILDTVSYSNLAKGEVYVITMQVLNATTGEAAEDGKVVTSRRIYSRSDTPYSGTVEMPAFTIDTSAFYGEVSLVAVESLYRADEDGNPIGEAVLVHDSLVDEDQTIRYPDVQTSACDSMTKDDVGTSSEAATVYDEVTVTNVIFDDNDLKGQYSYTVTGMLVYQQDFTDADGVKHKAGETVETLSGTHDTVTISSDAAGNASFTYADGSTAKGTVSITDYGRNTSKTIGGDAADNRYVTDSTASVATVTVELIYKVDSSKLKGGTTVVFENLYHNDIKIASHADLTDEAQSVHFPEVKTSALDGQTMDDVGLVSKNTAITDTVILTNLVPGKTYSISGMLINQSDGTDFTVDGCVVTKTAEITVSSDGKIIAANGERTVVTAYDEKTCTVSGTVDLTFVFDAGNLAGETVVVFEYLIHNEIIVASHADLSDEGQTIHFPEIHTTAADGYTGDSAGTVSEENPDGTHAAETVIIDTVFYNNLVPGREYTVCGILVNKDTGYELTDADNSSVMAERTFTAGETEEGLTATIDENSHSVSGTVDIAFRFDGSLLEGTTVVAFEDLVHNDIIVTSHSDIDDEEETIHFPRVRTTALDGKTGDEVGTVKETVIVDTVSLWNLVPGLSYTVSGVLMDKETGHELLVDGQTVTQTTYIAVSEDGTVTDAEGERIADVQFDEENNSVNCTVTLNYTLDASSLAGVTTVVFEQLLHNDVVVASHADITDLGQSVHFPEIQTTAADLDTSGHTGTVKEEAVILDTVFYSNLIVGREYTLKGTLMNCETGLPLLDENGETITASAVFTASAESEDECNTVIAYNEENDSVSGTYCLEFSLDSGLLSGKTVVVFETLFHNGLEVTVHADISDGSQSIYYPGIRTTAVDYNTGDHVGTIWGTLINFARKVSGQDTAMDAKQVITDTVSLTNLVPGQSYIVYGKLYNVTESLETGVETPLLIDGEEITQAVTVTVSEDGSGILSSNDSKTSVTAYNKEQNSVDGTVDLTYTLDSSKLQGMKVVVFEKLYQDAAYTIETDPDDRMEEDLVNEHSDITDEGQSVSEISIHTTAVDTVTNDHVGTVPDGTTTTSIHDEVKLAGLADGAEYTVEGVLVSSGDSDFSSGQIKYLKADGTLTSNREEAYAETLTFTSEETTKILYLNFALISDGIQGKRLTVFENIYHNGVLICTHPAGDRDDWDEETLAEQTVYYPAGKTNATDSMTDGHMSFADVNRVIVDCVYFENLLCGQKYSITGQLVYSEPFTDADGRNHTAGEALTETITVSFTAATDLSSASYDDGSEAPVDSVTAKVSEDGQTTINGYVSICFQVDASKLAGATLVAFETFTHKGADIFTHCELDDLPQTIRIPQIQTRANVNGASEATICNPDGSYADITITDTVSYENLWTEEELSSIGEQAEYYILKGMLMDKESNEALVDSNGNTYTVYSKPFMPKSGNGTYDVSFVLNAGDFLDEDGVTTLAKKNLVVYEELYLASSEEKITEETRIAEHKDINDEAQTIRISELKLPETTAESAPESTVKTGDALAGRVVVCVLLMGAAFLVMIFDGKKYLR